MWTLNALIKKHIKQGKKSSINTITLNPGSTDAAETYIQPWVSLANPLALCDICNQEGRSTHNSRTLPWIFFSLGSELPAASVCEKQNQTNKQTVNQQPGEGSGGRQMEKKVSLELKNQ